MKNELWTWRPLDDLFEIGAGKTMSATTRNGEDKIPFLRTSNVFWDRIDLTVVDEMSLPSHEIPEKLLEPGDLLVCEGGEIGRAAIWEGQIETVTFQNHLHRLRPKRDDVLSRFYVFFLHSAFTQQSIFQGAGNKTTIPNLSRNRLAALRVPHPSLHEQKEVVATLGAIRESMALQQRRQNLLTELYDGSLFRLMTGGPVRAAALEEESV